MENIDKIYDLLDSIEVTRENEFEVDNIRDLIAIGNYLEALKKMRELKDKEEKAKKNEDELLEFKQQDEEDDGAYPSKLSNPELEQVFIGLLLDNPKLISKYYFRFDDCIFEDDAMLNIYKSVLFNEGSKYSSEKAKDKFNFSKDSEEVYELKNKLRKSVKDKEYNIEKIYDELKKLFILRKAYTETPERSVQEKIVEITDYELYDKMSPEEVEDTIEPGVNMVFPCNEIQKTAWEVLKNFDHALILREDDPLLPAILDVYEKQGIKDGAPSNKMKGPAFKTELATAYPDCRLVVTKETMTVEGMIKIVYELLKDKLNIVKLTFTSGVNAASCEFDPAEERRRCPLCGVSLDANGKCPKCGYKKP